MPILDPLHTSELIVGALLGPMAGYLGTRIKNSLARRDVEEKRRKLVADTGRLIVFSNLLARTTSASPIHDEFEQAQSTIQATLSKKLSEIVSEFSPQHRAASRATARSLSERIFLTYRPRKLWWWMLHFFYYALLGSFVLSCVGLWLDRAEPDTMIGFLAIAIVFAIPGIIVNLLANHRDKNSAAGQRPSPQRPPIGPAPKKRSAAQRIFLLYRPRRRWLWTLHGLFYYFLVGTLAAPYVLWEDHDDTVAYSTAIIVGAALTISINLIANLCDKNSREATHKPIASSSAVSAAPSS